MSVLSGTPELSALGDWLTTGQVARLCSVDPRTVARWADGGLLRSHRLGTGRRRILRSDLMAFLRRHDAPLDGGAPERPRIALVDDDERILRSLSRIVSAVVPDADCRSASDGFAAGALVASLRPHLVLLDIVMPGLSGLEVCAHIKKLPELRETEIAVVSGHLSPEMRGRFEALGVRLFVEKPFARRDIERVVAPFGARAAALRSSMD